MKRRGQIDNPIIMFAVLVIGLLILAPVILKIFNSINDNMTPALANLTNGGAVASENFGHVMNIGIGMWDKVVMFMFFFLVIILFVSAFMVDSHPFFVILYIITNLLLILFAPSMIQAIDKLYDSPNFAVESSSLVFLDWIRTYYGEILVGMMVVTGIIIYGKIAIFGGKK